MSLSDGPTGLASALSALGEARASGRRLTAPPEGAVLADEREAYAAHFAAVALVGPIRGWKVGAPSPDAAPGYGALTADTIFDGPATLPAFALGAVEAEIAIRFARDLPAREEPYGEDEVFAAIGSWHAAIEILESAFADWKAAPKLWKIADRQSHGALVLGPAVDAPPSVPLAEMPVKLIVDGETVFDHVGGNTAGDPVRPLLWLVNELRGGPNHIKAGDVITTGSATPFHVAGAGQTVRAEFPELGAAELTLS
ncbi:2-keto-4-pentenoate hydratase [Methylopila turkensis]|uniref:Hydratase n=1 Tax=Methylopila turkensis TaxID=1437816 RepID=A0A9W6JLB3_9HYPH|nr:fumarylacetoacetate hydrolase family protein [Methylopila turkensis]GLK78501.1 hydratase [Methylopila turkensis]